MASIYGYLIENTTFIEEGMRLILNLPNRLIITLSFALSCLTLLFKIAPESFKLLYSLAVASFALLTLLSAIHLRMGKLDTIKNIVNALWNFETACTFCYAFYLFYDYAIYGIAQPELLIAFAKSNPITFVLISVGLGFVAIFRASISIAEIFKDSI